MYYNHTCDNNLQIRLKYNILMENLKFFNDETIEKPIIFL